MATKQIAIPFGYSGEAQDGGGFEFFEAEAAGTIAQYQCVKYSSGVATGVVVAATSAVDNICGIAIDAGVSGGLVRVVRSGFVLKALVDSSAGVTALDLVTAGGGTPAGIVTSALASATTVANLIAVAGTILGVALETGAASTPTVPVYVPVLVKLM